ncbi:toll/interleukin-1 receptor domain-containing protein [Lentzea aerocolonigenes]|uniref:toll/interleukin-1 receptor domain-containing protein n=1 Tax=Lentzea aerocolonigenes TaxID=68170 RepID=UPI000698C265|nr:TIR domain-containing protein [Lentzea aerocolonigenes]
MPDYEFDVAPSFAGEDRAKVLPIVRRLEQLGVRVFYDEDHAAKLWGANLVDQLPQIYGKQVRYVLMFTSEHYVAKKWTKVERQAAQARALEQADEYILPVRLDDTEVPGLLPSVVYLDLRRHDVETIAQAVAQKLAQHRSAFTVETPVTPRMVAALVEEEPLGWEHLLYAAVVWQGTRELESKYWEHFLRYAPRNGTIEHRAGIGLIRDRNVLLAEIIKAAVETYTADAQEAAFGSPGIPQDPEKVIHLGRLYVRIFDEILEWARDIHATSYADENARTASRIQARFADQQLRAMHRVVHDLRQVAGTMVERVTAGEKINTGAEQIPVKHLEVDMTVPQVFEVDPELEAEFLAAMKRLSP